MTTTITPEALERAQVAYSRALTRPGSHVRGLEAAILAALPELLTAQPDDRVTVWQMSRLLGVKAGDVIKEFMRHGVMATLTQYVDMNDAALVAKSIREAPPASSAGRQLLGYVRRDAIRKLSEDDEVTGAMVHVDPPTDSVPVYLAAPVAGEAAQQSACGHCLLDVGHDPGCKGLVEDARHAPAPAAVPVDELQSAVRVLLELPQLQGALAYNAQPIIDRVRAALATNPQPAAQGVDLGQFREAVVSYKSEATYQIAGNDGYPARQEQWKAQADEADRLLALIAQHQQKESGDV